MDYYGRDYPEMDPVPRIQNITLHAADMTDFEFHSEISEIFLSLRDQHTNYYLPGPYSCFLPVIGCYFDFIHSRDILKHPLLAVSRITALPQILDISGSELEKVELGDVLIHVDGKTFYEFYQENKWFSGGANEYGGTNSI
jgi:hypothetical protein